MKRAPSRRREERDARVDWILDAALDLAVREGLGALTTPRLARELGYTPAAFYRYFESKDALLLALETRTAQRYYARFFEVFASARHALDDLRTLGGQPRVRALARIALLAKVYASLAKEEPAHFRLVGVLVTGDRSWMKGTGAEKLEAHVLERIAEVVVLFAEAEELSALARGNPVERLMILWVSLHAVLAAAPLAEAHPELLDLDAMGAELLRALLVGWGADPREVTAATRAIARPTSPRR